MTVIEKIRKIKESRIPFEDKFIINLFNDCTMCYSKNNHIIFWYDSNNNVKFYYIIITKTFFYDIDIYRTIRHHYLGGLPETEKKFKYGKTLSDIEDNIENILIELYSDIIKIDIFRKEPIKRFKNDKIFN